MRTLRVSLAWVLFSLLIVLGALPPRAPVDAATFVPTGFTEELVASGLASPTAMQFAPDGRLFVCEQGGRLRVIENGVLLAAPFVTLNVNASGERGLLGVAFDPAFASNHFVYVYYTTAAAPIHNRISRFTANGNVAVAGSETIILELNNLSTATNHNGGALAFGPDGKLYAAVGENANTSNAQTLNNLLGKVLRINADGTIPTDNPFYNTATGQNRAIWALGLRNPFTFAFRPGGSQFFVNDVGQSTWEEINDGIAGSNYGWPATEGPTTNPSYRSPRYSYGHSGGTCAITGGAFYSPLALQFPVDYVGDYFFADYCAGWIRKLELSTNTATTFATSDFIPRRSQSVGRRGVVLPGARHGFEHRRRLPRRVRQPGADDHAAPVESDRGARRVRDVQRESLQHRPRFVINGSATPSISRVRPRRTTRSPASPSPTTAHNSARSSPTTSAMRSATSATLTVTGNQAPTGTIAQPVNGTQYSGANVINYSGTGSDPEDGNLPGSAFTWRVDFHHDTHVHPFIAPTSGASSGSFTIPTTGHTESNVWYRIYMTVRDAGGLTYTTTRDITPRIVQVTLATNPAGLQLRLDGQPVTTPFSFTGVVGIVRTLEAVTPQGAGGTTYEFVSWSDGGAATHNISTPAASTTYTATYRVSSSGGTGTGLSATYFDNIDLSGTTVARLDPTVDFNWGSGSPQRIHRRR